MTDSSFENGQIGHNNPPEDNDALRSVDPATIVQFLDVSYPKEIKRAADLEAAITRFLEANKGGITTEEINERVPDFVRQINQCVKAVEAIRKQEKEPFDHASKAVQGFFMSKIDPLKRGKADIERMQTRFLRDQEMKRRAEAEADAKRIRDEAEQKAREALERGDDAAMSSAIATSEEADKAEKVATASSADMVRTRGTLGGVATLRKEKKWEVTDISKVPLEYLTVNDALVNAHKKDWDEGKPQPIAGITFYVEKKASNR